MLFTGPGNIFHKRWINARQRLIAALPYLAQMIAAFRRYIADHHLIQPGQHLLLAVSGGLDSVVLCACCRAAGFPFTIAHCNFRLRGEESERDEAFVQAVGLQYGVEVWSKQFDTRELAAAHKLSVETMARELRYQWFHELVGTGTLPNPDAVRPELILTAHHADDNLETVAMHFFRGTGLAGLRGMEPRQGVLVRPLLFARRAELEAFAKEQGLDFVTDSSNQSVEYTRNFFRHRVVPLVQEVYPGADGNLLGNIARLRDAYTLYRESVDRKTGRLIKRNGDELQIPVEGLRRLPAMPTILYEIIKDCGFSSKQVPEVLALMDSETGRFVKSSTHRVFRNRRWLIVCPLQPDQPGNILVEAPFTHIHFPGGVISAALMAAEGWQPGKGEEEASLDAALLHYPLILRPWKAGDYFYPLGMPKKKKISRFLTDIKCSLTEKEQTWVLVDATGKIAWVTGRRIDHRFRITTATKSIIRLTFKRQDASA